MKTAIRYLEQWTKPIEKFDTFAWMVLENIPEWEQVEKTTAYLSEKGISMNDSIYEEVMYLKSFMESEKTKEEWKLKNMQEK